MTNEIEDMLVYVIVIRNARSRDDVGDGYLCHVAHHLALEYRAYNNIIDKNNMLINRAPNIILCHYDTRVFYTEGNKILK